MIVLMGLGSFPDALRAGAEVFHTLKKNLKEKGMVTAVGDEGGFAPRLATNEEAPHRLPVAPRSASPLQAGDFHPPSPSTARRASSSRASKKYTFDKKTITGEELIAIYEKLTSKYPLISIIEDGCAEDHWETWKALTHCLARRPPSSWATTSSSPQCRAPPPRD